MFVNNKSELIMEIEEYYRIMDLSQRRVRSVSLDFKRFLFDTIDWNDHLIAITGARGTGKTTLILQHIKQAFAADSETALYISLTGSSLLKINYSSGDLSRRQIEYHMPGLSYREYLSFEGLIEIPSISLDELLTNHMQIAEQIINQVKVLKSFSKYLSEGYYPFYKEVSSGYDLRLLQIINQILESDYPAVEPITYSTVQKIKKMLYILAQSCPQTPNMSELYQQLDTDRNQGLKMLYILERADLLNLLSADKATLKNMSRPDKIYCDNTNLMYALTENTDTGTKRETFFLNQLRSAGYIVQYPKQGDFIVNKKWLFEVGGKKKSFEQIKDISNSFLAVDDTEIGRKSRIPLWMFGLLY